MVEGWLVKRAGGRTEATGDGTGKRGCGSLGELRRKWEYRYFVVLRAKLNYYRSPEAYQQGVAPSGSINLRNATMWEYEREEEKLKGRIHKFVIVTPDRLYYMCAETREDLEMWFEGLGSVICQSMRTWSPAEVGAWLSLNRLGHLSESFQVDKVTGARLGTMDCEEGVDARLVPDAGDRSKLIKALQMVNRSGPGHAVMGSDTLPTQQLRSSAVNARVRKGGAEATCDIFLCFRASAQDLAEQFRQMLPDTADGEPWDVFMGNGEPIDGESDDDAVARHQTALQGAPNFIVLLTPGFFSPMENREGTSDIQQIMLANAMKMSGSLNALIVYTSEFKIPKPGKLPEALRPLIKYDFHKLDMATVFSRSVCMGSIHFDVLSDRKRIENGGMKTEFGSVGGAVQAMNDTNPSELERQVAIVQAFQVIATTLDGERQLYEHHAVEAIAACLGYNRLSPKNSNPVTDLQLVKQVVLTFSILSFNRYDKSRIKVIGVEHGIVALVEALIRITRAKTAEGEVELEAEVLTLACRLFQRLALSDHNLRELRTCGVVKVLKSCLSSKSRDLRTEAEQTMNQVLSLADG